MARESLRIHFRITLLSLIIAAGLIGHAQVLGNSQDFRLRMHQSPAQEYTAADVKAEIRFGKKVAARLLGIEKLNRDRELGRYISLIGNSLAQQSPRGDINFYFAVLDSDRVNAYSTPGGYIFITSGALALAKDEAEVAAILAHEIAHVSERHVVKELDIYATDQSSASGIARFLGSSGNTTQVAFKQTVDKAVSIIYESGYRISDEISADKMATLLLAQAGYDPLALKRYLIRAEKKSSKTPSHKKTHPAPNIRFSKLSAFIASEELGNLSFPKAQGRFDNIVKAKLSSHAFTN